MTEWRCHLAAFTETNLKPVSIYLLYFTTVADFYLQSHEGKKRKNLNLNLVPFSGERLKYKIKLITFKSSLMFFHRTSLYNIWPKICGYIILQSETLDTHINMMSVKHLLWWQPVCVCGGGLWGLSTYVW